LTILFIYLLVAGAAAGGMEKEGTKDLAPMLGFHSLAPGFKDNFENGLLGS
jgi:hypothetical protein